MSALAELSRIGYEVRPDGGRVFLKWRGPGKPPEKRVRPLLAEARREVDAMAGPWDPQKAGAVLSAALGRIAERCPAGCDMNAPTMREQIAAVDAAFEAGDGPLFLTHLAALERTAAEEFAVWRKERGEHVRAIKIFSAVLQAHLWITLDPKDTAPDPARYDAPVYSRAEVERLVEAHKRGEVSPDQLRALHAAKKLWPGIQVVDDPETAHEDGPHSTNAARPIPGHGPKQEGSR